ncbi:MAG: VCBS repeat-containing protein, partial [Bryobacterales bacterium]|nr:VCBS repeat-containing protein [Bryobacterales bacterium]
MISQRPMLADFDSDGWPDLAVAAGSTFESPGSPPKLIGMSSFLFANENGRQFQPVRDPPLPLQAQCVSRGLAVSDYDGDGDTDIAIVDLDGGVRLLRNDSSQGNILRLRLHGGGDRRWSGSDGAQATAWFGKLPARRTVSSASYLSQSSREIHIGMGGEMQADRVVVRWPDGSRQEAGALAGGVIWQLEKGNLPHAAGGAMSEKAREIKFWDRHTAAMDKLKRDRKPAEAARLFRSALALNPRHEDARYYLASCLAATGDVTAAVRELELLLLANPTSHRALQRLA